MAICEDCGNFRTRGRCSCKLRAKQSNQPQQHLQHQSQLNSQTTAAPIQPRRSKKIVIFNCITEIFKWILTLAIFSWLLCYSLWFARYIFSLWFLSVICVSAYNITTKKYPNDHVVTQVLLSAWQSVQMYECAAAAVMFAADLSTYIPAAMGEVLDEFDGISMIFKSPEDVRERLLIWNNSWILKYFFTLDEIIQPPAKSTYAETLASKTE